jgi:hypothetical protein
MDGAIAAAIDARIAVLEESRAVLLKAPGVDAPSRVGRGQYRRKGRAASK